MIKKSDIFSIRVNSLILTLDSVKSKEKGPKY
jgi:hypothetical protein